MKLSIHTEALINRLNDIKFWRKATLISSASILILSIALLQKHEKTILIPINPHKSFWVHGEEVSPEYLEEMGLYMAKLLLDLSPSTLAHNHKILLRYTTPEAYGTLKAQFIKQEKEYASLQLATHFKPTSVLADPKALTVDIKGTLTSYIAGKDIKTSSETMRLTFATRGSGLLLKSATPLSQEGHP